MTPAKNDSVVCECLGITESQVRQAVARWKLCDLSEIMTKTEAGTGCNHCHFALRRLLEKRAE
ncbi:MAG: (2Fe-2S)-binding protein [Elusimicrobia bacterium]|nr:(2Fe-2S)-binding protein [Elusimicrobiota bacterium]